MSRVNIWTIRKIEMISSVLPPGYPWNSTRFPSNNNLYYSLTPVELMDGGAEEGPFALVCCTTLTKTHGYVKSPWTMLDAVTVSKLERANA